jgi:hypothetical protein
VRVIRPIRVFLPYGRQRNAIKGLPGQRGGPQLTSLALGRGRGFGISDRLCLPRAQGGPGGGYGRALGWPCALAPGHGHSGPGPWPPAETSARGTSPPDGRGTSSPRPRPAPRLHRGLRAGALPNRAHARLSARGRSMTLVNATFAEDTIRQNRGRLARTEHVTDKDRIIGFTAQR